MAKPKPKPNKPKVPKPINIDLPKSGKDVAKRLMGSSTVNGRKVNESGLAQAAVAKLVAKHGKKIVASAVRNFKPTKQVKVTPIKGTGNARQYPKSNVRPVKEPKATGGERQTKYSMSDVYRAEQMEIKRGIKPPKSAIKIKK